MVIAALLPIMVKAKFQEMTTFEALTTLIELP